MSKKRKTDANYANQDRENNRLAMKKRRHDDDNYTENENTKRQALHRAITKNASGTSNTDYGDVWHKNELPTKSQVSNFEADHNLGIAVFRKMAGIPRDIWKPPRIEEFVNCNKDLTNDILAKWKREMAHDLEFSICAVCGIFDYEP